MPPLFPIFFSRFFLSQLHVGVSHKTMFMCALERSCVNNLLFQQIRNIVHNLLTIFRFYLSTVRVNQLRQYMYMYTPLYWLVHIYKMQFFFMF